MTTSDTMSGYEQPPASGRRLLRRTRTDRVAAGVSSGLGDYFGVDPVLFRVLFATSAFFGGAGILAYLLAWAAIPDEGTERAPIDGWIAALRRRRFPVWGVVIVGGLILSGVAFSWWLPGPFLPVVAIVILLIVFFTRRELQIPTAPRRIVPATPTVSLEKDGNAAAPTASPTWVYDARAWFEESRAVARERRRRSFPIRMGVLVVLAVTLTVLGIADAVGGIQLQWYFWSSLAVLGAGMVVALATRRWSWSFVPLALLALIGALAFAGSDTSLHDGVGQREWKPVNVTDAHYRLAFGQGVLDLRDLAPGTTPTTIDVTLGAGQVRVIAPKSLNLTVQTDVHAGQVEVDQDHGEHGQAHGGVEFTRTIDPLAGATGTPVTVKVHLTNGNLTVLHE